LWQNADALRVAAVLAADADLEVVACDRAALAHRDVDELADAVGVERLEGVGRQDRLAQVVGQEGARCRRG
jgi:hypothetical protein